jgi:hypothetical protein
MPRTAIVAYAPLIDGLPVGLLEGRQVEAFDAHCLGVAHDRPSKSSQVSASSAAHAQTIDPALNPSEMDRAATDEIRTDLVVPLPIVIAVPTVAPSTVPVWDPPANPG